jgi:plasmid stabilization system protein ParE
MSGGQKQYKVVVHDDAAQMLYSHVRFLANVSIPAATKLRNTFSEAIASLESMPYRCPIYQTRGTINTYRRLISGRYQLIFSISEEDSTVGIRYILDSRQDNDI